MQAAERGKLCSPNIINAAMTWHLQQHQNQPDCSSSLKGEDCSLAGSSKNMEITPPLSNKDCCHIISRVLNKPKTYIRPDTKHIQSLGTGYKVSTPRAAEPGITTSCLCIILPCAAQLSF